MFVKIENKNHLTPEQSVPLTSKIMAMTITFTI